MEIYLPFIKTNNVEIKINKFRNEGLHNKVFFNIPNDDGTAGLFIEAILKNNLEDAKAYISKKFVNKIDLEAVTEIFTNVKKYKFVTKTDFDKTSRLVKTKSVLFMENGISRILHLHMIQEPDVNGNWKIYGIEKE